MKTYEVTKPSLNSIQYAGTSKNLLARVFHCKKNEIKMNADLYVAAKQNAVFIYENKLADSFSEGEYSLNAKNLPVLSALQGWKWQDKDVKTFQADLIFVSRETYSNLKWSTELSVSVADMDADSEVKLVGKFAFRIIDLKTYIEKFLSEKQFVSAAQVESRISELVFDNFVTVAQTAGFVLDEVSRKLNKYSQAIALYVSKDLIEYGIDICDFMIEEVVFNESEEEEPEPEPQPQRPVKRPVERSTERQYPKREERTSAEPRRTTTRTVNSYDDFDLSRNKHSYSDEDFDTSPRPQRKPEKPVNEQDLERPLMPELNYYVAIDGKPKGPFNAKELQAMTRNKQLTGGTLVWCKGLANWAKAETQKELRFLFQ